MSTVPSKRADAAQNRERLLAEANRMFAEAAGPVSLEGIARAAGVGIGTLYRHFPTKEALVDAVYQVELDALDAEADRLLQLHPAADAMRQWMNLYARFVAAKHAMHEALRMTLTPRSGAMSEMRLRFKATVSKFLDASQRDGSLRADVRAEDVVLTMAGSVFAATATGDPDQVSRVLDLVMVGLRSTPV